MLYSAFNGICKQYIFISTACVYRRNQEDMPIKENSPKPNKNWSYNVEKFECEETLKSLTKDSKSYYTIVRPYITYDNERIPFGIAPEYKYHRTIIERIKSGKPMFIWGDGQTLTTSTYVFEFAVGLVGLFLNAKARNEDFHITSSMSYPVIDVLTLLFEKLGKKPQIVHLTNEEMSEWLPQFKSMLLGDRVLPAVFDNSKIKNAVPEFESKITLSEGLDKILEYYNKKSEYDYDYKYDALIDRMLTNKGVNCGFKHYTSSTTRSRLVYYAYRYFQGSTANRISRFLMLR
jgi:nucleoside-diphosphate-sugar epimerase